MIHLLDANVLITANRLYYPLARVPEFWDWLIHHAEMGNLKIPVEMIEEIADGTDDLAEWLSSEDRFQILRFDEEADVALVQQVINSGYAADLNDQEIEIIGRDPFLISYALRSPNERCVVTSEVSKPRRQRANKHIPDVCTQVGVTCMDGFALVRALDFSTSWREKI